MCIPCHPSEPVVGSLSSMSLPLRVASFASPNSSVFIFTICSVGTLASSAFHALGGVPDIRNVPNKLSAYDFVGCIGHVVVNGYLLDVAMPTKSHALESDCVKPTAPTKSPLLTQSCVLCNGVDANVCDYVLRRLPQSCSEGERLYMLQLNTVCLGGW